MARRIKKYEDNFIQLLKDNKLRIHQMIEDIRYRAEHNIKDFLMGLSNSNSTDMKTPDILLEKMFSKMSNVDGIICDPCCGACNLLAAAIKAGFDPTKVYGIEIDEEILKIAHSRLVPLGVPKCNIHLGDALDSNSYNF